MSLLSNCIQVISTPEHIRIDLPMSQNAIHKNMSVFWRISENMKRLIIYLLILSSQDRMSVEQSTVQYEDASAG